ncbi:MAG: DEAD/DEAH box helicase, partial [Candidatus Krumholzibacteriia bacterium]
MLDRFVRELRRDGWFDAAVAAARVQPARPAAHAEVPVRGDLRRALARLGVERLYTHQAEALRLAREGRNVVVATPTASGKTLCFNIPVLETILAQAEAGTTAHALYLFPLKALEQDQLKNLLRLRDALGLHESFRAAILDGDTKESGRRKLRADPPHILLSNPDMLHASILPGHDRWARFFSELRYIVLDELHTYRGVFGSHVLQVLRRLRRIAERYGARPQVIAASATIHNPEQLAEQLFALPFETVHDSGAPAGPRHVLLLDPPDSALGFATTLFSRCVLAGVKTIAFCKSRRATELLYTWAIGRQPELRGRVSAYRSGYLAEERREIESALFGGQLQGVVATSALEMGIDVGGLDAAILVGYPGSIMSTWQRGGRAGRGTDAAGLFLVAGHDALDQYYVGEPDAFFRAAPEAAVVDATNATIRSAHFLCAGAEMPLGSEEPVYADLDWRATRQDLQARGLLLQSASGDAWVPLVSRPHRQVNIRQIGDTFTIHPHDDQRRVLGTIGGSRVFAECHEGAVYLHRGQHLFVGKLDLERQRVIVSPADGSCFTVARSAKQTEILADLDSRPLGTTTAHYGRLRITQRITGYEKRATLDQKLLGTFELDLPPTIYETEGLWIEVDPGILRALEARERHRMGSLHGIEHAFIALSPLFTLCDAADLGGITFSEHPQVQRGAIFVYDSYPGGIGLAARSYEILPQVLDAVRRRIEDCACTDGCPGCVHSPRCGSGNYPLDKEGSNLALRVLLGLEEAPRPQDEGLEARAAAGAALDPGAGTAAPETAGRREPRVVYFDLETQRAASEVGGWHHIDRMGMALAVVYDEREGRFVTFRESQVAALVETLLGADLVVGYNLVRFDYAVLSAYTHQPLERIPTFDMLLALRQVLGFRPSLDTLARSTLGTAKSADGLQSLAWVRDGRLDRVEEYCRQDVALTRDLFRHAVRHGTLCFERGGGGWGAPPRDGGRKRLVQAAG